MNKKIEELVKDNITLKLEIENIKNTINQLMKGNAENGLSENEKKITERKKSYRC